MWKALTAWLRALAGRPPLDRHEQPRAEQQALPTSQAARIAHELRNPLMSMKILVQAALEKGGSAALSGRDLLVLEEEMNRLEASIKALLEWSGRADPPTAADRQEER